MSGTDANDRSMAALTGFSVMMAGMQAADDGYSITLPDALPPAAFASLSAGAPISTMTWAIDLFEPAPRSETGWWLVQGIAETIRHGYSAQTTVIWSPDGRPVLSARQNVAIFARQR